MEISVLTLIFGTILGVVLALMRDSHIKVVCQTGTDVHLDLERNPADGAGISDLFRFAKPGHYFQRYDSRCAFHVFKYRRNTLQKLSVPVSMLLTRGRESSQSTWNALASGNASNCGTTGNQDLHSSSCKPVYCHHQKYFYFVRHHFDRADKRGNPDRL